MMRDYTLALGEREPYGFSAESDGVAIVHAVDYLDAAEGPSGPAGTSVVLSSPDGILTTSEEDAEAFRRRIPYVHAISGTDDVRPGDPTPPDCNMA